MRRCRQRGAAPRRALRTAQLARSRAGTAPQTRHSPADTARPRGHGPAPRCSPRGPEVARGRKKGFGGQNPPRLPAYGSGAAARGSGGCLGAAWRLRAGVVGTLSCGTWQTAQ